MSVVGFYGHRRRWLLTPLLSQPVHLSGCITTEEERLFTAGVFPSAHRSPWNISKSVNPPKQLTNSTQLWDLSSKMAPALDPALFSAVHSLIQDGREIPSLLGEFSPPFTPATCSLATTRQRREEDTVFGHYRHYSEHPNSSFHWCFPHCRSVNIRTHHEIHASLFEAYFTWWSLCHTF